MTRILHVSKSEVLHNPRKNAYEELQYLIAQLGITDEELKAMKENKNANIYKSSR